MKLSAVLLLAVVLTGTAYAAPPQTEQAFLALPQAEQEVAALELLKAPNASGDVWAQGGVGIAGTRPLKFLAYEALLRRRGAAEIFTQLLKSANPYTQLYALKGLSRCAPETFRKIAPTYLDREETILRGQGCILTPVSFGQIVREIQSPGITVPPVAKPTTEPVKT